MRIGRVPPVLPVPSWRALGAGAAGCLGWRAFDGRVEQQVRLLFPEAHEALAFCSGRAALAAAMEIAVRATGRRVVVLPAFTSYSVAAAAAASEVRVRLCDVRPETLDFDPSALDRVLDESVAAVVLGNPFGFPSELEPLREARLHGAIVIDDAAQALGAKDRSGRVGERGDLGVLSFGRGKCVTTGNGGALLVLNEHLRSEAEQSRPQAPERSLPVWLRAAAVRVASSRVAFGVVSRMGVGDIGTSRYAPTFRRVSLARGADGLAYDLTDAVARGLSARRAVAQLWSDALAPIAGAVVIRGRNDEEPAYLRAPVLVASEPTREVVITRLRRVGFAHVRSYPSALGAIPSFRETCGADEHTVGATELAARLLALPCHGGVGRDDVARACEAIAEVLQAQNLD